MPNVYKLNTVSLFEDLKDTNIKCDEFKSILSNYDNLESKYIKANEVDLLKDLTKQKEVLFSYFPCCKKESTKKVASMLNNLEKEIGNIEDINTFNNPAKNIQFVKIAFKNGKWIISTKNLDDIEISQKQTPEAISCVVDLAERLDEQEAAYALCHAKKAGLFTFAALPYVRTTDTAMDSRYVREPGTVLGPVERSVDSTYTENIPVSRQTAAEIVEDENNLSESDVIIDENGNQLIITTKTNNAIITSDNNIIDLSEAEEKLQSGAWKKTSAEKEDSPKEKKVKKQLGEVTKTFIRDEQIELEAGRRLVEEYQAKINNLQKSNLEKVSKMADNLKVKAQKYASKLDSLTLANSNVQRKLQRMSFTTEEGVVVKHSLPVKDHKRMMVSTVKAEEVLEDLQNRYGKGNEELFQELNERLFKYVDALEQFSLSLASTPETEEEVREKMDYYRRKMKSSINNVFKKNLAYKELDNMLFNGDLNFNQYNELCNCVEIDTMTTIAAIKDIKASLNKQIKSGILDTIIDKMINWYDNIKSWFESSISILSRKEKETKDIIEKLDQLEQLM